MVAGIKDVPELFDRVIVATALLNGAIVLTKDPDITASTAITAVW